MASLGDKKQVQLYLYEKPTLFCMYSEKYSQCKQCQSSLWSVNTCCCTGSQTDLYPTCPHMSPSDKLTDVMFAQVTVC